MNNVLIIAEAGVNHNGDINLAKKLIDTAKYCGADVIKFQTWITEDIVTLDSKQSQYQIDNTGIVESQFEMLKKLELSYDDFIELKRYCDEIGIQFLSTGDEEKSIDFLADLQEFFKVGSGELDNLPLLKHVAKYNRKTILSTGMGNMKEIGIALETLISAGCEKHNISVLQCTTNYPADFSELNLRAMYTIKNAFDVKVGFSDHSLGIEAPIAAVAMGACIIEKHFTLDTNMAGPDHKASLNPKELKQMVTSIRNIEKALGTGEKTPTDTEIENIKVVRKSLHLSTPKNKGEIIEQSDLILKRPGDGINSYELEKFVGKKINRDLPKDYKLTWDVIS